jgi:hypothetical protein
MRCGIEVFVFHLDPKNIEAASVSRAASVPTVKQNRSRPLRVSLQAIEIRATGGGPSLICNDAKAYTGYRRRRWRLWHSM